MTEQRTRMRTSIGVLDYLPIKSLTSHQTRWKVQARIVEKGNITTFQRRGAVATGSSGKVFSCVLMDKEGTQINAKFWNTAADDWHPKLEKGNVYSFSKGRIGISNKRFAGNVPHDYEIIFDNNADIAPVEEGTTEDIPLERKVQYQSLRGINLSTRKLPFMTDVLAVVHTHQQPREVASRVAGGENRKRRQITVVDATKYSMDVTLWGEEADVDDSILADHAVVGLHGIQIREWRGRAASTVNNSDLKWNLQTDEAKELKVWYEENSAVCVFEPLSNIAGEGQTGSSAKPPRETTLKGMIDAMSEALVDEPMVFRVQGYCTNLLYRNARQENSLNCYYQACSKCNRKLASVETPFCTSCSESVTPVPRLAFTALVSDISGSGQPIRIFHEVAQTMIGLSGTKVVELVKDLGAEDPLPAEVLEAFENHCLWRRYLFTVRGRRENYQGEVRAQYQMLSAAPLTKGQAAATAMSSLLKNVPNAFEKVWASKKRMCVDHDDDDSCLHEQESKRLKAADVSPEVVAN